MLTIQPETFKVLRRWASAQEKPVATAISALLDEQRPMLLAMAEAFEAAQAGKSEAALRAMQSMTGRALSKLGKAMEGKKHK